MAQMLDNKKPEPADLIEISRGAYQHWAIYIEDDYVIHIARPSDAVLNASNSMSAGLHGRVIVKREKLSDVVGNDKCHINNLLDDKYKPRSVSDILKDAESRVGQKLPYSVIQHNCEHFVTELRYGKPESRQVRHSILVTIGTGVVTMYWGALIGIGFFGMQLWRHLRRNWQ